MSKKNNDETIDLLYLNSNSKKSNNRQKNKNVPKQNKNDIINLDEEFIIGLTPKPKQSKEKQMPKNVSANKSKKLYKTKNTKNKKNKVKPKKRLKIIRGTSILIFFVGAIVLFLLSPIFNVKQITIEGIEKISRDEIINLSQIKIEQNTFKIRGVDVIERIKSNNYIEKVEIKRELPSGIKITVKERKPQYIIEIVNGNAYIDSNGYILEISAEKIQAPKIIGYETTTDCIIDYENTNKLLDEDCRKIKVINDIYDACKNNAILEYITSIDISDIDNIKLYLDGEKKVAYLGNGSNANLRILYLKTMIEEEMGNEGEAFINGDINAQKPKPYFRERV